MASPLWRFEWEWSGAKGINFDIDPKWTESSSLFGGGTSRRSVEVSFVPKGLSVAAKVEAGNHPLAGSGSLYMGDTLILASRWQSVEYDVDGAPITITLSESPQDDKGFFPPIGQEIRTGLERVTQITRQQRFLRGGNYFSRGKIDRISWPVAASGSQGQDYPVVIGSPGDDSTPAVPAYEVRPLPGVRTLLVSGYKATGHVLVFGTQSVDSSRYAPAAGDRNTGQVPEIVPARYTNTVDSDRDGTNSSVSTIDHRFGLYDATDAPDASNLDYSDSAIVFTSWGHKNQIDENGDPSGSAVGMTPNAGDLLFEIASSSTSRLDMSSFGAAKTWLNRYRFDGYLDQRVNPLGLIQNQFLPLLPASLVSGKNGVGIVVWPWVDGYHSSTMHIIEGGGFARASRVSFSGEPVSAVTFSYAYDVAKGVYSKRKLGSPDSTAQARLAMQITGDAAGVIDMESKLLWDDATVSRILTDKLTHMGLPKREIRYNADPAIYGVGGPKELTVGQQIDLTDAGLRFSRKAAVISGIERSVDSLLCVVMLRDDPMRPGT